MTMIADQQTVQSTDATAGATAPDTDSALRAEVEAQRKRKAVYYKSIVLLADTLLSTPPRPGKGRKGHEDYVSAITDYARNYTDTKDECMAVIDSCDEFSWRCPDGQDRSGKRLTDYLVGVGADQREFLKRLKAQGKERGLIK